MTTPPDPGPGSGRSRRRRILVILALLVATFALLRETGALDVNVYWMEVASRHTGELRHPPRDPDTPFSPSYHLRIWRAGEIIHEQRRLASGPMHEIDAELELDYDGPYWLPLYKSFTVDFTSTAKSREGGITSDVKGQLDVTISGFCTRSKVYELVDQSVLNAVTKTMESQLAP